MRSRNQEPTDAKELLSRRAWHVLKVHDAGADVFGLSDPGAQFVNDRRPRVGADLRARGEGAGQLVAVSEARQIQTGHEELAIVGLYAGEAAVHRDFRVELMPLAAHLIDVEIGVHLRHHELIPTLADSLKLMLISREDLFDGRLPKLDVAGSIPVSRSSLKH